MCVCVRVLLWRSKECLCISTMSVCMCVCTHERVCVFVRFSIETCCSNANRHLTPACNGSGFIGIWEKAVYIVSSSVTNGHDNGVRQGLVSPFLCLTSLDNVYTLSLKCAPVPACRCRSSRISNLPSVRSLLDGCLYRKSQHYQCRRFESTEQESLNLIYNNWI